MKQTALGSTWNKPTLKHRIFAIPFTITPADYFSAKKQISSVRVTKIQQAYCPCNTFVEKTTIILIKKVI